MRKIKNGLLMVLLFFGVTNILQGQTLSTNHGGGKLVQPLSDENPSGKTLQNQSNPIYNFPPSVMKDRYQVDLILPLIVNGFNNTEEQAANTIKPVLDFYKGIRLAAYQLEQEHIKIDLKVHTIDTSHLGINNFLLQNADSLKQSSLIIGFLQSDEIKPVADFANTNGINLFSALSPSDAGVTDNPYFTILQPTLTTHIQKIVDFGENKFPSINQILIYDNHTSVQRDALKFLSEHHPDPFSDSLSSQDFIHHPESILSLLDSTQENLIYTNILSTSEARNLLQRLSAHADSFNISVFGMPSWNGIPGLTKANSFPRLDVYFSNPFYYIPGSPAVVDLVAGYKNQFDDLPSQFSFRGYEIFYWGAHLLNDYGSVFNSHLNDSRWSPFTHFNVQPSSDANNSLNYWENKNCYIFHYLNGVFNIDN